MPDLQFTRVEYREPHLERTRRILQEHPELKELFGPVWYSALIVVGLVAFQVAAAWLLRDQSIWLILASAWLIGAFADHALWVLIHEATHNLILKSSRANILLGILANLPILFPSAIAFRKYHLLHHRFQGDPDFDADLPGPTEVRLVKNIWWRKALWLFLYFVVQSTRVRRLKNVAFMDGWYLLNCFVQVAFLVAVWTMFGGRSVGYLFFSSIFAIGLHPVGGRWIQEHFLTGGKDNQETFSYYGPLNTLALNVGYHNEHHDVMRVPWTRLPKVRAIAHEYYDGLYSHSSWTVVWLRFIFDPKIGVFSRVVRDSRTASSPTRVDNLEHVEELARPEPLAEAS